MVTVWQLVLYCSKAIEVHCQPVKVKPANVSTDQIKDNKANRACLVYQIVTAAENLIPIERKIGEGT